MTLTQQGFRKYAIGPIQELQQSSPGATKPELHLLRGGYTPGWRYKSEQIAEGLKKILPEKVVNRVQTHGYLQLPNSEAYRNQVDNWDMPNGKPMPKWIKDLGRKDADKVTPELMRRIKRHQLYKSVK